MASSASIAAYANFGSTETALRAAKARTFDELLNALAQALQTVTDVDAWAWFAHCGYAPA